MAAARPWYGSRYRRERAKLLFHRPRCELRLVCHGAPANSADHDPPISRHYHIEGSGCCILRPACMDCQHKQASELGWKQKGYRRPPPPSRQW